MYATVNLKERYKQDYISTASPADLVIMLYEGCIKKIKLSQIYLESGDIEQTSNALVSAQNIIGELMSSLDMSFDISKDLFNLYDYMMNELVQMNVRKELDTAPAILDMLTSLKNAWVEAKLKTENSMVCEQY
jgi:flagellar biosynthetic protein FliS